MSLVDEVNAAQAVREVLLDEVPDMHGDTLLDIAEAVVEELRIERRVATLALYTLNFRFGVSMNELDDLIERARNAGE